MSLRVKESPAFVHTLDDDVVVTVTKTTDPENGAVDVVVEKDKYVDGKIEALEVDRKHAEGTKGHVEIETSHVEAGNGRLTIDKTVKDVTRGHVDVKETHTEVKDSHVVEIVTETEMTSAKGGLVDSGTYTDVKTAVIKQNGATGMVVAKGNVKVNSVSKGNVKTVTVTKGAVKGAPVAKGTTVTKRTVKRRPISEKRDPSPSSCMSCMTCCGPHHDDIPDFPQPEKKKRCTCCTRGVHRVQKRVTAFVYNHSRVITLAFNIVFLLCYYAYFGYAMYYKFGDEGSIRLLCVTLILTAYLLYRLSRLAIKKNWTCCCWLVSCFKCIKWTEEGFWRMAKFMKLKIILCVMFTLFFIIYSIVVIGLNQPKNLISAGGMALFIGCFFILSDNPEKVKWRPVFAGLSLQFVFALMLMRTKSGSAIFLYLGDRITEFIDYAEAGARFVFGPDFADHFFAFKVLPVVIFFSSAVSILFHYGVMQFIVKHIGRVLALFMNTSPVESVVAIANIFVGQSEAPVLAGPYLEKMTRSELHTIMTSGFATVSGPIMAAYILYDIPVIHLLSASVMSAPAAIGMSKLFYPETEDVPDSSDMAHVTKIKGRATNIIEAASDGAISAIKIVANIIAHLIAFVSLLMFLNAVFVFLGHRVGLIPPDNPELTFQLVYSYFFWPFALLMGVDIPDCQRVAELIGTKMVINEFAAYHDLHNYIDNKATLLSYLGERNLTMASGYMSEWYMNRSDIILNDTQQVLTGGILTDRSTVISTYALCGFSNFSAMGIMIGVLVALIPKRKADISRVVFRAMIAGNVASFMTACMAGLLYTG